MARFQVEVTDKTGALPEMVVAVMMPTGKVIASGKRAEVEELIYGMTTPDGGFQDRVEILDITSPEKLLGVLVCQSIGTAGQPYVEVDVADGVHVPAPEEPLVPRKLWPLYAKLQEAEGALTDAERYDVY